MILELVCVEPHTKAHKTKRANTYKNYIPLFQKKEYVLKVFWIRKNSIKQDMIS